MFKGRTPLPGQHRPGLEAAPPLASWRPGHRQALPGSRGGQPCASPAPPSPHTAPPRGQAGHLAPLRRASCLLRLHVPPPPGQIGSSRSESGRPAHLVQSAFLSETRLSSATAHSSPSGCEETPPTRIRPGGAAGWLTVQPLLPDSGRGRGVSGCLATKRPGNTDAPGTL